MKREAWSVLRASLTVTGHGQGGRALEKEARRSGGWGWGLQEMCGYVLCRVVPVSMCDVFARLVIDALPGLGAIFPYSRACFCARVVLFLVLVAWAASVARSFSSDLAGFYCWSRTRSQPRGGRVSCLALGGRESFGSGRDREGFPNTSESLTGQGEGSCFECFNRWFTSP